MEEFELKSSRNNYESLITQEPKPKKRIKCNWTISIIIINLLIFGVSAIIIFIITIIVIINKPTYRYLIKDGIVLSEIIISPNAPEMVQLAAKYFQFYIENMTDDGNGVGGKMSIRYEPSGEYNFTVYIGKSNYTDELGVNDDGCVHGGYKRFSGENYLILLGIDYEHRNKISQGPLTLQEWEAETGVDRWGNQLISSGHRDYNSKNDIWAYNERGTMNSVQEFLYDQGIRLYYPNEVGSVIPNKQTIKFVADYDELVNADYTMRYPYLAYKKFSHLSNNGLYTDEEKDNNMKFQMGLKINHFAEFFAYPFTHGIRMVMDKQYTIHPEFYALVGGVRQTPDHSVSPEPDLCFPYDTSENILFREHLEYIKAMFDLYDTDYINVMPLDGFDNISDECAYLRDDSKGIEGRYSNYAWEYMNNLAWAIYEDPKYSHKMILGAAYSTYLLPPDNITKPIAPNMALYITRWRSTTINEDKKEFFQNAINEWLSILPSGKFYTYDYYLHNSEGRSLQSVPVYFPHIISEDIQFLKGKSIGELMEVTGDWPPNNCEWDQFISTSLNVYISCRLYWDTSQNVDELLDEYYDLYFGPAREEMKQFVEYSEENFSFAMVDSRIIQTQREIIQNARNKVGDDVYGKRIDLIIDLMKSEGEWDEIPLDSCQELRTPNGKFKLTQDVSSTGTCFSLYTIGITIDCDGHTITYGTDGGLNVYGVYAWKPAKYEFTIKNCNIVAHPTCTGTGLYCHYLHNFKVLDTNITNPSSSGIAIIATENFEIDNVIINAITGISTQTVQYGSITNSVLHALPGTNSRGVYIFDSFDIIVDNNVITSDSSYSVYINEGGNNTVTNNVLNNDVREYGTSNNEISGNTIV